MNFKSNASSQSGFSLVEIMIAMGMAGVVGLGAAYVVQAQVVQRKNVAAKMDLNGAHAIALQQARNLQFINDQFVTRPPAKRGGIRNEQQGPGTADRQEFNRCLAARTLSTDSCAGWDETHRELEPIINESGLHRIVSTIDASLDCPNNSSCEKIVVRVSTEQASGNGASSGGSQSSSQQSAANQLATTLEFPAFTFVPVAQLDQACTDDQANPNFLTSVNSNSRTTACVRNLTAGISSCESSGNSPMLAFGNVLTTLPAQACAQTRARECNPASEGIGTIGDGSQPIQCRTIASLTPPAAPPITAPVTPPLTPPAAPPVIPPVTSPVTPTVPTSCTCPNIVVSGRTWTQCGAPGIPSGNQCLIDSYQSNNLPPIGCTRASDLGFPESCSYTAPVPVGPPVTTAPTPLPPAPVTGCPAGPVNWAEGGASCSGVISAGGMGATAIIRDEDRPNTGIGRFTCNAGAWTPNAGSTCSDAFGAMSLRSQWYFVNWVSSQMCNGSGTYEVARARGANGACPFTALNMTYRYPGGTGLTCSGRPIQWCIQCAPGSSFADNICLNDREAQAAGPPN